MAKNKEVEEVTAYEEENVTDEVITETIDIAEEAVNNEEEKPDLYLEVPEAENGVDPIKFAARQKAVFSGTYNVIFVDPEESSKE